jgi:hypothetical protein
MVFSSRRAEKEDRIWIVFGNVPSRNEAAFRGVDYRVKGGMGSSEGIIDGGR